MNLSGFVFVVNGIYSVSVCVCVPVCMRMYLCACLCECLCACVCESILNFVCIVVEVHKESMRLPFYLKNDKTVVQKQLITK